MKSLGRLLTFFATLSIVSQELILATPTTLLVDLLFGGSLPKISDLYGVMLVLGGGVLAIAGPLDPRKISYKDTADDQWR